MLFSGSVRVAIGTALEVRKSLSPKKSDWGPTPLDPDLRGRGLVGKHVEVRSEC